MKTVLYVLIFIVVVLLVARFLPADAEPFHEDPAQPDKRRSEVRLIGREAPRFQADATELLDALVHIAREDGARIAEGSADEGMITFVARSKILGFRDFITVKAVDEARGMAKLSVLARPRWNGYDWGANTRRLDRWLGELEQTFRG